MGDELDEYVHDALKDPAFRTAYETVGEREFRTFRHDGIYRRRFQWWYPWGVADWWKARFFRGGDEWCNDSACLILPPLGGLALFWRPGRLRAMPCPQEWNEMDDWQRADYAPCGYLHGGRLNEGAHHHIENWPCNEARTWLALDQPIEYCTVHDRPIGGCGSPDDCRETMRQWGLYPEEPERQTPALRFGHEHGLAAPRPSPPAAPLPGDRDTAENRRG